MAKLAAFPEPMNVEAFLAFYDTRPDGEKWELLDGELFMNATPAWPHQKIVHAIAVALENRRRASGGDWEIAPGIGVRLSDFTSVEPDLMIRPDDDLTGSMCDDIIVAIEVLSPSTRRNDLEFKRLNYASLPSLTHYIVVSPEQVELRVFARAAGWREVRLLLLEEIVQFDNLNVQLPLAEIYASTRKPPRSAKS